MVGVVGMRTIIEIGEVAVQVDIVAIVACGTRNRVVTAMVGTIGVGVGENEEVYVVQDV